MPAGDAIYETLRRLLTALTESELTEELHRATRLLGFEQFAMGHHVDLLHPPDSVVRITNYDPEWIERALTESFFADDPVHLASTRTATGFLWSDIASHIDPTARQLAILEIARSYGLHEGYTVPVHVPGEYRGTCSFGARSLTRLGRDALPAANLIGIYAFEAARQIRRSRISPGRRALVPKLTDRQHDTLVLIGRGKADREIASVLGISSATAHEHVENVRRAYGYAQRPNLVARALFDGQISFADVLAANLPLWSTFGG